MERFDRLLFAIGMVYFAAFAISPQTFGGKSPTEDPMVISGFAILLGAVLFAWILHAGLEGRLRRLTARGVLLPADDELPPFEQTERIAKRTRWWVLAIFGPLTLGGIWVASSVDEGKFHLLLGAAIGVWLVSARFAWAIASGWLIANLRSMGIAISMTPDAKDHAGGLRPLGNYFLYQTLIVLLPCAVMLFWIVAASLQLDFARPYWWCEEAIGIGEKCSTDKLGTVWNDQFVRLILAIVVLIFTFGVMLPVWSLRREMKAYKRRHFDPIAEDIEREILAMRTLSVTEARGTSQAHHEKIREAEETLDRFRDAPTLPLPVWEVTLAAFSNLSAAVGLIATFV